MSTSMDELLRISSRFSWTEDTVRQLEAVVVNGEPAAKVARREGVSRQTLSAKVVRYRRELKNSQAEALAEKIAGNDKLVGELLESFFDVS